MKIGTSTLGSLLVTLMMLLGVVAPLRAADQAVYNFVRPLDDVRLQLEQVVLPALQAETNGQGEALRRVTFNVAAQPQLSLSPNQGTWDWSGQGAMSLRIQNAMDWDLTLLVRIESLDGQQLSSRIALPAGPAQTLLVPLQATSPIAQGMRAAPPMPWSHNGQRWLVATEVSGQLDARQIKRVKLSLERPQAAQSVLLGRFGSHQEAPLAAVYRDLLDAYGQSTRRDWPGKIASDAQLKKAVLREQQQVQDWLKQRSVQDRFGGWLTSQPFTASGFFRTEQRDGQWYLVTPQGNPFFSLGVNAVTPHQSQTYISGRQSMFRWLPAPDEPLAAFYGQADSRSGNAANRGRGFAEGQWFDFYAANRARSYGQADLGEWRNNALQRLRAWGFNTLGGWSEGVFSGAERIPYTISLSIQGDFATIDSGNAWWGGVPDPFDPRFAMAVERAVAINARDHREDPWLLGFFADNELAWASPGGEPQARYALAYATLRLTTDVPAKRAFLKQLRDKYRNHEGLSKAWGIELKAWELMEDPGFQAPVPSAEYPAIEEDLQRFLRSYADTYFKTIADSLEWHAPNHLLLGGRFAISTPEAVAACAQYCDVLSFNLYTREPEHGYDFAALKELNKPVLISEFHFGSRDRGPFWGGVVEVYKEEERGPAYAQFLEKAARQPLIVGAHWFQYLDQPASGRLLDGENGHLGLVAITDRPWQGFVEQVRKANLQVPRWLKAPEPVPAESTAQ